MNKILSILFFTFLVADVSNDSLAVLIQENKTSELSNLIKETKYLTGSQKRIMLNKSVLLRVDNFLKNKKF